MLSNGQGVQVSDGPCLARGNKKADTVTTASEKMIVPKTIQLLSKCRFISSHYLPLPLAFSTYICLTNKMLVNEPYQPTDSYPR